MEQSFRRTASFDDEAEGASGTTESLALTAGGIAALLSGACCVAPFVLVSTGLGGLWLANLQLLEPYRPVFIGISVVALGVAGWRIHRASMQCRPDEVCATRNSLRHLRVAFWSVAALLLAMLSFPYLAPLFL